MIALALAAALATADTEAPPVRVYSGASDASTAEFLDADTIVVGDDESNVLRVYRAVDAGRPLSGLDVSAFLNVDPAHPEADIEASARAGDRIYWITSHGPNRSGELRESRDRFFATDIVRKNGVPTLVTAGKPCSTLAPAIGEAFRKADLPASNLNIEALGASPDGKTLYIGFRAPSVEREGKRLAIVLPLRNPAKVIDDGAAPDFAPPLLWNLAGNTLRSLDYDENLAAYFAIASPVGDAAVWTLFRWSGDPAAPPVAETDRGVHAFDVHPEAVAPVPGTKRLLVLADDGTRRVPVARREDCKKSGYDNGTCRNKDLKDPSKKSFRGFEVEP